MADVNIAISGVNAIVGSADGYTWTVQPFFPLQNGTQYTVRLVSANDTSGNAAQPMSWSFTTIAEPSRAITGVVQLGSGKAVAGVSLAIIDPSNASTQLASSGEDGGFSFTGLVAGRNYVLTASYGGYEFEMTVATAGSEVVMRAKVSGITGVVRDLNGSPLTGTAVTVSRDGQAVGAAVTDGSGRYSFPDLPKNYAYTVKALSSTKWLPTASVTIASTGRLIEAPAIVELQVTCNVKSNVSVNGKVSLSFDIPQEGEVYIKLYSTDSLPYYPTEVDITWSSDGRTAEVKPKLALEHDTNYKVEVSSDDGWKKEFSFTTAAEGAAPDPGPGETGAPTAEAEGDDLPVLILGMAAVTVAALASVLVFVTWKHR